MMEQATACDGLPVSQARTWAHSHGAPYYRFCTPMTKFVEIDAKDNTLLVQIMWDAMEYIHT